MAKDKFKIRMVFIFHMSMNMWIPEKNLKQSDCGINGNFVSKNRNTTGIFK
jgi:hypothetical protein